jgi:hypothetical protein
MDARHEECYVVFLRRDHSHAERRECDEQPVMDCATYEEARQLKQAYHGLGRECVIRYVGPSGGGD